MKQSNCEGKKLKYLRCKTKNPKKYKVLKAMPIFKYLDTSNDYFFLLGETLLRVVKEINENDIFSEQKIFKICKRIIRRLVVEEDYYGGIEIPKSILNSIISDLSRIFGDDDAKATFKGEILEYFVILTESSKVENENIGKLHKQYKIRLEPEVRYKRKILLKENVVGFGCDVDVIAVDKDGKYINLVECKYNLDGNIKTLQKKMGDSSSAIFRKINYMEHLKIELQKIKNSMGENLIVRKRLVSVTNIKLKMPVKFEGYELYEIIPEYQEMLKRVII